MSVYIISGKDTYRAEAYLRTLLEQKVIGKDRVTMIDGSVRKFRLEEALMECGSFSLFDSGESKAVIIRDPSFLTASQAAKETAAPKKSSKAKNDKDSILPMLEQYLASPNPDCELIFFLSGMDADSRRKEYKLLVNGGAAVQKFDRMKDKEFGAYADRILRENGIRIDRNARSELLERTGTDTMLLHNAVDKILLYGKKDLDEEDIRNLVAMNADVNIWKMSDSFLSQDLAGVLKIRDEMLRCGYDYNAMFNMLASRLRNSCYMKQLYENGLSYDEIAVRIQGNAWVIQKNLEKMYRLSSGDLLRILSELADLDQDIKSGRTDIREGFDAFLLRNVRV
ncbi:MAG: DNA polymerase III subunit delta [Solobacterium sp.]|nr:DNA polymerase III subunit delta [Solobacterium sp.]